MSDSIEVRATQLQSELHEFVRSPANQQSSLPTLIETIHQLANRKTLEFLARQSPFQKGLERAIINTLDTPFLRTDGSEVKPWKGGFTIVVLISNGTFVGAGERRIGSSYRPPSTDLFPYALSKAAIDLYLFYHELSGGIEENWSLLEPLMPQGRVLYQGDYTTEPVQMDGMSSRLMIGASGTELTHPYRESLAPGMIRRRDGVNFILGYSETTFAQVLGRKLALPKLGVETYPEPDIFRRFPRLH